MTHIIPMSEKQAGVEKKRKKPTKLSDRSREYLKGLGYIVTFVERSYEIKKRIKGVPTGETYWVKADAFGIVDVACVKIGEPGVLFVQTTESSHAAEHKNTILGEMATRPILQTGNRIHLHVWKKKTVQKREIWTVQVLDLQLDNRMALFFRELGVANDVALQAGDVPSLFSEVDDF